MGKPKYIFITRIQHRYWLLRFRLNSKVIYRQSFFDTTYKSKEAALQAAIGIRDDIAKEFGIDLEEYWHTCKLKSYRYTHKTAKTATGIVGVTYSIQGQHRYYRASIQTEQNKKKYKSFNCNKLGDKKALQCAIAQRAEWEQQYIK